MHGSTASMLNQVMSIFAERFDNLARGKKNISNSKLSCRIFQYSVAARGPWSSLINLMLCCAFPFSLNNQCPGHSVKISSELPDVRRMKFGKPRRYKSTVQIRNRIRKNRQRNTTFFSLHELLSFF